MRSKVSTKPGIVFRKPSNIFRNLYETSYYQNSYLAKFSKFSEFSNKIILSKFSKFRKFSKKKYFIFRKVKQNHVKFSEMEISVVLYISAL